jgi:hypothetical protein
MATYKPDIVIEIGVDNLLSDAIVQKKYDVTRNYMEKKSIESETQLTPTDISEIDRLSSLPVFFKDVNLNSSNAPSTQIKSIRTVQAKLYDNPYMQQLINEGYRPVGSLVQQLNTPIFLLTMRYTKNPDTQPSDYFTVATAGGSRRRRRQTKKRVVKRRKHKTNRK